MRLNKLTILIVIVLTIIPIINAADIQCTIGDDKAYEDCVKEHGTCTKDNSNGYTLVCWVKEESQPKPECKFHSDCKLGEWCKNEKCEIMTECTTDSDCNENKICSNNKCITKPEEEQLQEVIQPETQENKPQPIENSGTTVTIERTSGGGGGGGGVNIQVETVEDERAELNFQIIQERINDQETLSKPRLDINLQPKKITKIPQRIDTKLFPYTFYSIITLAAGALLISLWIVMDIVSPRIKF